MGFHIARLHFNRYGTRDRGDGKNQQALTLSAYQGPLDVEPLGYLLQHHGQGTDGL